MNKTNLVNIAFFVIAILVWVGIGALYFYLPKPKEVVYNCTWSEINPDIPPKVKEECRKLRMEKIK